ncbi:hypothetical protein BU17DRAFT_37311 [Hysterangium stoloniferum]|nr:hypothetical protein BU17DRAFT_37311 [Hysterangium stoloniferum]
MGANCIRRSLSTAASPVKYEFTAAQITRRAAKEIRTAIQAGNVSEALVVSNSVLSSPLDHSVTPFSPPSSSPSIIFERPLPSRLVSHCLVHALLRGRYTIQAGTELQKMIDLGIRFHSRTLKSTIALLCSSETQDNEMVDFSTGGVYETQASPEDSSTGHMISSRSSRLPPKARLAVNILSTARQRRHRRTEDMYGRLIDACLLQGEIIIATLLFVLLVKDWQLRRVLKLGFPAFRYAKQSGLMDPSFRIPCPENYLLEPIIKSINYHVLSRDTADEARLESIDSMAILAAVVAERSISLKKMTPIIRCLQNCPLSPVHVTTARALDGGWREINAYDKVHEVLVELCHSLPGDGPSRIHAKSTSSSLHLLPRLDLTAYNSLIHYALRHRMSPALANKVIEHMLGGNTPVKPDIVTYNILLRSASLLTRNDLANKILHELSKQPENSRSIINSLQLADGYTLSSYITHVVSTGQPEAVVHLVSQLLPAVSPRNTTDREQDLFKDRQLQIHRETVQRAIEYGPYILSALLNALCKAGRTGLAERVWKIAREAEETSWREQSSLEKHSPWCLPIQAYTSMLQCYANENKKGLARINRHILHAKNQEGGVHNFKPLRSEISRLAAWRVVNEMRDAATTVWEEFMRIYTYQQSKQVPLGWAHRPHSMPFLTPDARFFNVLLNIFGHANMWLRGLRQNCSKGQRMVRFARARFTRQGELFWVHDINLVEVLRLMAQFGYEVPLGFRRVLVGRPSITIQSGVARAYKVPPWAFPEVRERAWALRRRRLYSLEVFKTRGLPVQKISKRRRGLNPLILPKVTGSLDIHESGYQLTADRSANRIELASATRSL